MKKGTIIGMKPQDIVIILKIALQENKPWTQLSLANSLFISQSEISESIYRSKYARLLVNQGKQVNRRALLDLLQFGVPYVFPQQPGEVVRGVPTSHSAAPLSEHIMSNEHYVWPYAKGKLRGHSIQPLFPTVVQAVQVDPELHELLALVDALRVGRARERNLSIEILNQRLGD